MSIEHDQARDRPPETTAQLGADASPGRTSLSAQLDGATQAGVASAEAPEVANARATLRRVAHDREHLVLAIKTILEIAAGADPKVARQLLDLVVPHASLPGIAHALDESYARLEHRKPHAHAAPPPPDAVRYNSAHPENVAAFNTATNGSCVVDGALDAGRVADWQSARGLDPDGKIGPATITAAQHATPATSTSSSGGGGAPTATSSSSSGGGGAPAVSNGVRGKHPPPRAYLAKDPALAQKQIDLRLQQYDDDAKDPNFVEAHDVAVTVTDLYREISRLRPDYPKQFRVMMAGHTRGEQGDSTLNYNFAGLEPYWMTPPANKPWTRGLRSATIAASEYTDHPERYLNWASGNKGTIEDQLARHATTLYVCFYGPRPAYANLSDATSAFVFEIARRVDGFRGGGSPYAAAALGGDVEAYIHLVHDDIPGHPKSAYNGLPDYPGTIRPRIQAALRDPKLAKLD